MVDCRKLQADIEDFERKLEGLDAHIQKTKEIAQKGDYSDSNYDVYAPMLSFDSDIDAAMERYLEDFIEKDGDYISFEYGRPHAGETILESPVAFFNTKASRDGNMIFAYNNLDYVNYFAISRKKEDGSFGELEEVEGLKRGLVGCAIPLEDGSCLVRLQSRYGAMKPDYRRIRFDENGKAVVDEEKSLNEHSEIFSAKGNGALRGDILAMKGSNYVFMLENDEWKKYDVEMPPGKHTFRDAYYNKEDDSLVAFIETPSTDTWPFPTLETLKYERGDSNRWVIEKGQEYTTKQRLIMSSNQKAPVMVYKIRHIPGTKDYMFSAYTGGQSWEIYRLNGIAGTINKEGTYPLKSNPRLEYRLEIVPYSDKGRLLKDRNTDIMFSHSPSTYNETEFETIDGSDTHCKIESLSDDLFVMQKGTKLVAIDIPATKSPKSLRESLLRIVEHARAEKEAN